MTGHIPESFIEALLSKIDIVDVVGASVSLRRMGTNYSARCPFHNEKTPSFTVSQTKQFYHCFGCGAHGNAIRFLMEHSGLHFVDAIESLAAGVGLTVPKDPQALEKENKHMATYSVLLAANEAFQHQLARHALKDKPIQYLKSRGINGKTAKEFNLGYALPGWEGLLKTLGQTSEGLQNLLAAGLIIAKEKGRYYDRFRDRIMFPIRDRRGRVVGFGGRVIDQGEPKYLNSPETHIFNKGTQLYGLYEARLKNPVLKNLLVVEGYLDVVSLAQAGITQVVATLGTALTEKHVDSLFRQVNEVIFCFDGDLAGIECAGKALKLCLPEMKEGRTLKFIILPNGEDPDSFLRKHGKVAFLKQMQDAKSLSDFLFQRAAIAIDLQSIEGRSELIRVAKPLIMQLPKGVFQQMMLERLEQTAGLPTGTLVKPRVQYPAYRSRDNARGHKKMLPVSVALRATSLLLKDRRLFSHVNDWSFLNGVDVPGTPLLCAVLEILQKESSISLAAIEEQLPVEYTKQLSLADLILTANSVPEDGIEAEFAGALERLRRRAQEQSMELLLQKAKHDTLSEGEKARLKDLLEKK